MRPTLSLLVGLLAVVVLTPWTDALPGSSASCNQAPAGATSCAFASGRVSGTYAYPSILVPSGVVLTVAPGDVLTLVASNTLTIQGQIQGGRVLTLHGNLVEIDGTVAAAEGSAASSMPMGGSVIVSGGFLTLTGTLEAGDGAPGADATPTTIGSTQAWIASPGAKGGDVVLGVPSAATPGTIHVGDGGAGGEALAWFTNANVAPNVRVVGGAGGASGSLLTSPTFDPLTMHQLGIANGGAGGPGGNAATCVRPATQTCDATTPPPATESIVPCRSSEEPTTPEMCWSSFTLSAAGGAGGPGFYEGGQGGVALADAGKAAPGHDGANAAFISSSSYATAQQGQPGLAGGNAYAWGGAGGPGALQGGDAGRATALSQGGDGGRGGNGASQLAASPTGDCPITPRAQGCYSTTTTPVFDCLAPAQGGAAGPAGDVRAHAGQIGLGLAPGQSGAQQVLPRSGQDGARGAFTNPACDE